MDAHTLNTQARTGSGKGNARQLRRDGLIPAVFYGPATDTTSLQVSPKDLTDALSTDHGRNQLLKLQVDGKEQLALVKELQVHPVTRAPLHVDFYSVNLDSVVEREVPLKTTGRARGVLAGGELRVMFRHLPMRGAPNLIPAAISVEVSEMDLGDSVKVRDISIEAGVAIAMAEDSNLVAVVTKRHRPEDDEEETEGAAAGDAAAATDADAPAPEESK